MRSLHYVTCVGIYCCEQSDRRGQCGGTDGLLSVVGEPEESGIGHGRGNKQDIIISDFNVGVWIVTSRREGMPIAAGGQNIVDTVT